MADYNLGTASGSIRVDASQLKNAAKDIAAFVDQTRAKLNELKGVKGLSLLAQQMKLEQEQVRKQTAEYIQSTQREITVLQSASKAKSDATKLEIQQSKARIEQMRIESNERIQHARQQERVARQQERQQQYRQPMTAGMPAGMPFFASFTLMPFSAMAAAAGNQQLSSSLMTGGAALGIIDTLPIISAQFEGITQRFKEMGGVMGVLSTAAQAVVSPIGLIAAGIAAVALVMLELNRRFEEAKGKVEDYVQAQIKLNQQVASGLTSEDIEEQLAVKRRELELNNQSLNSARQYQRSLEAVNAAIAESNDTITAFRYDTTNPMAVDARSRLNSAQATRNALAARYDAEFPRAAGGLDAVGVAVDKFTENADTLTASISELETASNSAAVQINDLALEEQRLTKERIDDIQRYVEMTQRIQEMTRGERESMADGLEEQISQLVNILQDEAPEVQDAFRGLISTLLQQLGLLRATAGLYTSADAAQTFQQMEEAASGIGKTTRSIIERIVDATVDEVSDFRKEYADRINERQGILRTTADIQQQLGGMTFDQRSKMAVALERQIADLVNLLANEPEDVKAGFANTLNTLQIQQAFAEASLGAFNEADVRAFVTSAASTISQRFANGLRTAYDYVLENAQEVTDRSVSDIQTRLDTRDEIGGMTQEERAKRVSALNLELRNLDTELSNATPSVRAAFEEYRRGLVTQRDELVKTATLVTGADLRSLSNRAGQMVRLAWNVVEFNIEQGQRRFEELAAKAREAGEALAWPLAVLNFHLRKTWQEASEAGSKVAAFAEGVRDGARQAQEEALRLARALEDRLISAMRQTEDRLTSVSREAADYARTRMYAIIDFLKEMEKAENEYNERIQEIQEDHDEEEADRLEDHLLDMERIRRRAQTDILNAAMRLDAIGIYEAKRRRDEELRETEEDYQRQKEQRDEAFQEQIDDEKKQFEELKREREAAFREQLRREDEQRSIRLAREQADYTLQLQRQAQQYALEDQRRQQDYALRIAQMMQHNQILQGVVDAGLNGIRFAWNYVLGQMQSDTLAMGTTGGGTVPDQGTPWAGWTGTGALTASRSSNTSVRVDNIVLGDIGERSDDQVVALIDRGLRSFFAGGVAMMRG